MTDFSLMATSTPVQVMPGVAIRRSLTLFAPGVALSAGGAGDLWYSFSLTGSALVPGAPGTFYLAGGQTVVYGNQPGLFAPNDPLWAVAAKGNSAPLTAMAT